MHTSYWQEGKSIFRVEPVTRAASGLPNITPLLVSFGGHRGALDDGCVHERCSG